MKNLNQKTSRNISRRDFLNIAKRFGMTSTLMAASALGSAFALPLPSSFGGSIASAQLAQAAEDQQN